VGAHREAVAQYARALRFGTELPAVQRADMLTEQARSCLLADLYDLGIDALEQEIELRRALGDRLAEGDATRRLADFLWCPGRTTETRNVAEHAVEILETLPPSPALAHAYCCLGWSYNRSGDSAEARLWGGRAVELADRFDCDALASDARAQLAVAEGDVDALLVEIERALELENF